MPRSEQPQNREQRKERFMLVGSLVGKFGAGAFKTSKPEEITLTVDAAELEQVDLLIEQGLYPCREDFFQAAARNLLQEHGVSVSAAGQLTVTGIVIHNRKSLERLRAAGRQLELSVTGILRLSDDVTPELACAVIKSLRVCGAFQASAEIKAALKDRIR